MHAKACVPTCIHRACIDIHTLTIVKFKINIKIFKLKCHLSKGSKNKGRNQYQQVSRERMEFKTWSAGCTRKWHLSKEMKWGAMSHTDAAETISHTEAEARAKVWSGRCPVCACNQWRRGWERTGQERGWGQAQRGKQVSHLGYGKNFICEWYGIRRSWTDMIC